MEEIIIKKVIWRAYYNGVTGYINASRKYPYAMNNMGIKCEIDPINPLLPNHPMQDMVCKDFTNGFKVLHQLPTVDPNCDGYFTVTEFDKIPPYWEPPLRQAKIILTQSKFCKEIISKSEGIDPQKIHICHYILDENMVPKGPNYRNKIFVGNRPISSFEFVFGSIFEWVARKKPELMWQAFIEEFPYDEYPNVLFLNRITIPGGVPHNGMRDWKHYIPKDPRISILREFIPSADALNRTFDCYVSSTAGEGWSATLCESLACGIPTIGSRHSGNLEFMTDDNSWLVDVNDWSYIGKDPTNFLPMVHEWQRWKLPKIESIRKNMREIYELKMAGKVSPKIKEGLKVHDILNYEYVGKQFVKAFEGFL